MDGPSALRRIRLSSPWVVGLVVVAGVALHLPSLGWGFFADDWWQRLALEQPEQAGSMRPWSLYDFGDLSSQEHRDGELLPWWVDPGFRARFFRPVTSVVLWAEHALFGGRAVALHGMSLLWHGLFLVLAWRLYRAVGLGAGASLLALGLLAADDGAVLPVGWIANRNSLLEGVASAAALLAALRARAQGRLGPALGALALALVAVGSKESGIAVAATCALVMGTASARGVRRAGLAAGLLALATPLLLLLGGYGAASRYYPMPWSDLGGWSMNLLGLSSVGLVGTVLPLPLDALVVAPAATWPLVMASLAVLALLAKRWCRALGAMGHGRFLAFFALCALVPQASAPPGDRLLFVSMLGLAPVMALLLVRAFGAADPAGRWARRGLSALFACALPLSAILLVGRGQLLRLASTDMRRAVDELELERHPTERRDVFLLQSPSALLSLGVQAAWRVRTGDRHTRFHPIQFGGRGLRWTRSDERTFVLESLGRPFLEYPFEGLLLGPRESAVSMRHGNDAFEAETLSDVPIWKVRFRCSEELEAARYVFLEWSDGCWRRCDPPAVGQVKRVDSAQPLLSGMP